MGKGSYLDIFRGTSPQLVAVFFGTLNALSDGMHFGWSAPTIPILLKEDSPIPLVQDHVVWLETLYMLAGLAGLPITIYLADKIGRQKSVLVASCTSLIGWTLIGFAKDYKYLYLARSLVGAAADVAFTCSPMYVAEIAHPKIRGFLAASIYIMEMAGVFVVYCVAPYVSIRIVPIIGACILITQLMVFPFMPESPYYHLYKGKTEKAKKSLLRIRNSEFIDDELQELEAAIRRQKSERGHPQDLVMVKSNRKALITMTILNAAQHMAGFTAILMNLHTILNAAGATYLDSNVAAILFSGLMLVSSILSGLIVDKYGRKNLLNISSIMSAICVFIMAAFYHLKHLNYDVTSFNWIPVVFVMIYAAFFKFGLGIIPIVMTAELFPAKLKAMGMTLADGLYVLFASISIYLYTTLYETYGLHVPFYMFGVSAFITVILSVLYIPETKGKTLEEIQLMLKK